MLDELRDKIIDFFTSRLTVFTLVFIALAAVLLYRCFDLQIVHGQEYLDNFILQVEKTRELSGTRGNIYDRNGNLLAYNELAYNVKIEDVFENNKNRNKNMNEMIYTLIHILEKRGDHVSTDFRIVINEDGEFEYTVDEGTTRQRFIADVYGKKTFAEVDDDKKESTALELMQYLSSKKNFAIGEYADPEDSKSEFVPGKGYSMDDWLKIVTIRYAMKTTSYQKYLGTIAATDISPESVAAIMENSDILPGVTVVEDTVRKYVDSKYFAHVLGYTGKISSTELADLNERMEAEGRESDMYSITDVVGKSGIEAYMETTLQGHKGYEKVVVDNLGKVIEVEEREEAQIGNDVYLSIDKDLTEAVYSILEQKLAGLVSSKIINAKEYIPSATAGSADIKIAIYDVYYQMFNNSVIDLNHMASDDAGEVEQQIYQAHEAYKLTVYEKLVDELKNKKTPYNKLTKEYMVYESNLVSLLYRNGILISDLVNSNDPVYIAWTTDEVISAHEFLNYCIAQNWVDASKLGVNEKYTDSAETYEKLVDYVIEQLDKNTEFQKKMYKYMLLSGVIKDKQVCMALCEQEIVNIPEVDVTALYNGKISAYQFMMNRINNIDITPAQLALDPCNGSVVITNVNTGEVLAMVSYPGYDNNKMANSIDAEYYAKLTVDKAAPLYNFATQYKGAPGSTFKMLSATAGLMEGMISLHDEVYCKGTFTEITPSPRCWKRVGHGPETVTTAIKDSCNYFFYNLGYQFATRSGTYNAEDGLSVFAKYADMYGLSEKSGVEISEASPEVSDIDPVRSAIGQGNNSYTTAALARYVSAIANNGTVYQLTLLEKVTDSNGLTLQTFDPVVRNVVDMPADYWNAIHKGMRMVVQNKSYFNDLAVNAAGKTGTAEQTKSRPNHALFVCYAPYENPEVGIATRIPFGYSSDYAAQVTRDIIKYYYGLAEEDELINGTADRPDAGISNEW